MAYLGPHRNRYVWLSSPNVNIICTVETVVKRDNHYDIYFKPCGMVPASGVLPFKLCAKLYNGRIFIWGSPYRWCYAMG